MKKGAGVRKLRDGRSKKVRGNKSFQVLDLVRMLVQKPHQPSEIVVKLDCSNMHAWRLLEVIKGRFKVQVEEKGTARFYSIAREDFERWMEDSR